MTNPVLNLHLERSGKWGSCGKMVENEMGSGEVLLPRFIPGDTFQLEANGSREQKRVGFALVHAGPRDHSEAKGEEYE